jgi:hypothetical protein
MPTRSDAGASVSQMSVSIASSWQKKNRFGLSRSELHQCSNNRRVMPVTPG